MTITILIVVTLALFIINVCLLAVNIIMLGEEFMELPKQEQTGCTNCAVPEVDTALNEDTEEPLSESIALGQTGSSELSTDEVRNQLSFLLDLPKDENEGEDAPPLLLKIDNRCIIGVFDGMGGAGAEVYQDGNQKHTGAYFASRITKDLVEQLFVDEHYLEEAEMAKSLKESIVEGLQKRREELQGARSLIVSKLIKTLPTTMAISLISKDEVQYKLKVLWAGDSRIYCLSPSFGLVQLTKDDLNVEQDPFQNLYDDSSLKNMVNLSQDFTINELTYERQQPFIVLAATDGCFGYLPSPMHFEELLLRTMQISDSIDEWKAHLIEELREIACDDCTMALYSTDVDYIILKENFYARYLSIRQEIETINNEINSDIVDDANIKRIVCEKHWQIYKSNNYPF